MTERVYARIDFLSLPRRIRLFENSRPAPVFPAPPPQDTAVIFSPLGMVSPASPGTTMHTPMRTEQRRNIFFFFTYSHYSSSTAIDSLHILIQWREKTKGAHFRVNMSHSIYLTSLKQISYAI